MKKRPTTADAHYFAFSAKDWRSSESVRLMPLAARGAFIDLLAVSWLASEEPCSIPASDQEIASLLGVGLDEWRAIAPRVLAEFDETTRSGRLRNARLWKEYQGMKSARRKMSQGGKTSALRRRDEHGRLLPAPSQAPSKHLGKVASGSPSHSQSPRQKKKLHSAGADAPRRDGWLDPVCRVWEAKFGAGSFAAVAGEAAKRLKPIREGGQTPGDIAEHVAVYLSRTEPQFVSVSRFAKLYAQYAPIDASALVDEHGVLTTLGEKETRGARVA